MIYYSIFRYLGVLTQRVTKNSPVSRQQLEKHMEDMSKELQNATPQH